MRDGRDARPTRWSRGRGCAGQAAEESRRFAGGFGLDAGGVVGRNVAERLVVVVGGALVVVVGADAGNGREGEDEGFIGERRGAEAGEALGDGALMAHLGGG